MLIVTAERQLLSCLLRSELISETNRMIEFLVSTSGLEFDEVSSKLSGTLRQKLIERLTDIAFEAVFWGAPVKSGYLASTVYKDEGKVGATASYAAAVE